MTSLNPIDGIDGLVCDLDGVIYRGNEPVPGAAAAVARLHERGVRIVFCTNNSAFTAAQYRAKLRTIGMVVDSASIVTSAEVTAAELVRRGFVGKTALVIGRSGLRRALTSCGILVAASACTGSVDAVVVGWDPHFTYATLQCAADAVRAGAAFVATNGDPTAPTTTGLRPEAGALLAAVEVAAGRRAEILGKPHRAMMEAVAARLGDVQRIAVIGDRPDTDLAGGTAMGWRTILVLSGVTSASQAARVKPSPDVVLESIADLR